MWRIFCHIQYMHKTYQEIFNQRGADYHHSMLKYPQARKAEFETIIQLTELSSGQILLDMPSGGGYLEKFIDIPVRIISIETSSQFIRDIKPSANQSILLCHDITKTPLPDACADRIISLAGLHHLDNKPAFFQEVFRLLKPGGLFCLADAHKNSSVARFLNVFVNEHNSMGHSGTFLDETTPHELRRLGFELLHEKIHDYDWQFETPEDMAGYCKSLFGIDKTNAPAVIEGIDNYLGCRTHDGQCLMSWSLYFLKGRKP